MTRSGALSAALMALCLAAPVSAAPAKSSSKTTAKAAPAKATPAKAAATPAAASSQPAATATSEKILTWANIGIYDVRFSTPFGTVSDAEFGIAAGGAVNVAALSPDVPLAAFANLAISFASGGQFFPLTAGLAARYDKLPVHLLGGLGLTLMPNSAGTDTGIGAGIMAMGIFPLPSDPRLGIQGQIQFHLLNHSMSLLEFVAGVSYSL